MSNVTIIKGNLFDAPKGSIIAHACNCQGVWGSGIAKQFKTKFPEAFKFYNRMCQENGAGLLGTCLLIPDGDYTIACLFTSAGFGGNVDSVEEILDATEEAIDDLLWQKEGDHYIGGAKGQEIHMCKINSGLFGVPWEQTHHILEMYTQEFTVYEF